MFSLNNTSPEISNHFETERVQVVASAVNLAESILKRYAAEPVVELPEQAGEGFRIENTREFLPSDYFEPFGLNDGVENEV